MQPITISCKVRVGIIAPIQHEVGRGGQCVMPLGFIFLVEFSWHVHVDTSGRLVTYEEQSYQDSGTTSHLSLRVKLRSQPAPDQARPWRSLPPADSCPHIAPISAQQRRAARSAKSWRRGVPDA